jgi:hypothetical protein
MHLTTLNAHLSSNVPTNQQPHSTSETLPPQKKNCQEKCHLVTATAMHIPNITLQFTVLHRMVVHVREGYDA